MSSVHDVVCVIKFSPKLVLTYPRHSFETVFLPMQSMCLI